MTERTETKTTILLNITQTDLPQSKANKQINAVICSGISIKSSSQSQATPNQTTPNPVQGCHMLKIISSTHKVFPSGDAHVKINEDVSGKCIFIFQGFSSSQSVNTKIMEALICADALKIAGAKKVVLVAPYLPYSRQDKPAKGESLSFALISKAVKASGIDSIITYDCHSQLAINQSLVPIINITASNLFKEIVEKLKNDIKNNIKNHAKSKESKESKKSKESQICVISTDEGGRDRANSIAKILKHEEICGDANNPADVIVLKKDRNAQIGDNKHLQNSLTAEDALKINNKTAIIVDDIVDGGFSLENAAAIAKQMGATKVIAMISNCLIRAGKNSNNLHKLQSVDKIFAASCISTDDEIDNIAGKLDIIESSAAVLNAIYCEIS